MMLYHFLAISSALVLASAAHLQSRGRHENFGLFAYGEGIGGKSVFYMDGLAYVGDPSQLGDDSGAAPVIFVTSSSDSWMANPNGTSSGNGSTPTFSNATFFAPPYTSSSHQIGFLDSSNNTGSDDDITAGWMFYGHVVVHRGGDDAWSTLFQAIPTDYADIWALNWNSSDNAAVPVTLKDTPPSNK